MEIASSIIENVVGLVGRLSNWLAGLSEEEVAWARRGVGVACGVALSACP